MSFWGNYNTSVFREIEICCAWEIKMCHFREIEIFHFRDIKILQFSGY